MDIEIKGLKENTFYDDYLGRDLIISDIFEIIKVLSKQKSSCCMTLNGRWGIGKTFILNKLEEYIDNNDEQIRVVRYNCWEHDFYYEPIISIISSLTNEFQSQNFIDKEALIKSGRFLVDVTRDLASHFSGINFADRIDDANGGIRQFDDFYNLKEKIFKIRSIIQNISNESTIVFIVDELDRCLPEYAIKVLERLHHVFNGIDNFITILAIDNKQLENNVKTIFGDSIDYEQYMRKYIDLNIYISEGNLNDGIVFPYFDALGVKPLYEIMEYIHNVIIYSKMDVRNIKKIFDKIVCINNLLNIYDESSVLYGFEFTLEAMRYLGVRQKDKKDISIDLVNNLSWFINMDKTNYNSQLKELLGEELFNYYLELSKSIKSESINIKGGIPVESIVIHEKPIYIIFWIISQIFDKPKSYFLPNKQNYMRLFDDCKNYYVFSKRIN